MIAAFEHRLTREGDPGLHVHCVAGNVVETADERRSAIDGVVLRRHRWAADGMYQAVLRAELTRRLGVRWIERNDTWEIEGVPAAACREFSKRSAQIKAEMAARGTSGGRAAQAAALAHRKPKAGREATADLHTRIRAEYASYGRDPDHTLRETLDLDRVRERLGSDLDLSDTVDAGRRSLRPFTAGSTAERVAAGSSDEEIIEHLLGPEGLTEKASGFGHREVFAAVTKLLGDSDGAAGEQAYAGGMRLATQVIADPRVHVLLARSAGFPATYSGCATTTATSPRSSARVSSAATRPPT